MAESRKDLNRIVSPEPHVHKAAADMADNNKAAVAADKMVDNSKAAAASPARNCYAHPIPRYCTKAKNKAR